MSTANKLTYLNVTKQKLKQAINNIGGEVTDETTFREYVNQLENAYDRLPKTEFEEGESVTLENTLKAKLDFDDGKVGYGQASQETTQGYQLMNLPTFSQTQKGIKVEYINGVIKINGTASESGWAFYTSHEVASVESGQTYTYSLSSNKTATALQFFLGCEPGAFEREPTFGSFDLSSTNSNRTKVMSASGSLKFMVFGNVTSGTTYDLEIKPMLEIGSTAHAWEPYTNGASPNPSYPQEIKYVRGKNLFDGEFRQGNQDQTRVTVRIFSAENNWKLKVGKTYTISTNIDTSIYKYALYIAQFPYLSVTPLNTYLYQSGYKTSSSFTFTCNYDGYFGFTVAKNSETDITPNDMENVWFQVEENSQATSYLLYNTIEEVVSGKNEIPFPYYDSDVQDRNGVNWSVNENGTINASGTANSSSSIFYICNGDDDLYLDPGTYKISSNFSGAQFSWQVIQIVNGSYGTVYWDNMVLTERTRLRVRVIAKPNTEVSASNCYLMIERGNTATTYEPYITPKTYQFSLGDNKFYGIGNYRDTIRRSSGKNLFDEKTMLPASRVINGITYTNNGDGTFNVSGTATTGFFVFNISVGSLLEKGKKYGLYSSKEYSNPGFNYTLTFTGNSTRYVIANADPGEYDEQKTEAKLSLWVDNGATLNATNVRTMIYESDTKDTDYEPYGVGNWYKFEKIGYYKITGQETINRDTPNNRFELDNLVDILHLQARQQVYCNRFQYVSSGSADYGMFAYWNGAITQVFVYDKDYTDPSDLQNYFANNETYFCYIRNTPVLTPITGTLAEQLEAWWNGQSLDGTTIIEGNGDLPMIIKVRGLKGE